jgi:hypothetical protein
MEKDSGQLEPVATIAVIYLVAPLLIFFAAFVRVQIALPAFILISCQLYEVLRRTSWRETRELLSRDTFYIPCLATALLWWLYNVLPFSTNGDWHKHYAIINFLVQHPWPPEAIVDGLGNVTLRYYVGWYLVPAAILKLVDAPLQHTITLSWSVLGLSLFLKIMSPLVRQRRATIAIPLIFLLFSGASIVGLIVEDEHPVFTNGYLQWWAGWIQYCSNIAAIAYAPQHAISAWLGTALLMRYRHSEAFLKLYVLVAAAVSLWSPFSALGLFPFFCLFVAQCGLRKVILDWRPLLSVVVLVIPIAAYLTSAPEGVPHGLIGSLPCVMPGRPCFSIPRYILFILIEISGPFAILFWRGEKEQGVLVTAAITLCVIPLYLVGEGNDFAMRVSGPAIAVLSILSAKALIAGPRKYSVAMLIVLLLGLPGVFADLAYPLNSTEHVTPDVKFPAFMSPVTLRQYLVRPPLWIFRKPQSEASAVKCNFTRDRKGSRTALTCVPPK